MKLTPQVPSGMSPTLAVGDDTLMLHFPISGAASHRWAHLLLGDGVPVATLDLWDTTPFRHSLERVQATVASYRKNNGAYSQFFYPAFGVFDHVATDTPSPDGAYRIPDTFSVADASLPSTTLDFYTTEIPYVDEYQHPRKRYATTLHMVTTHHGEERAFTVYCPRLIREAITRHNQRTGQCRPITPESHNLPHAWCEALDI